MHLHMQWENFIWLEINAFFSKGGKKKEKTLKTSQEKFLNYRECIIGQKFILSISAQ